MKLDIISKHLKKKKKCYWDLKGLISPTRKHLLYQWFPVMIKINPWVDSQHKSYT